MSAPVEQRGFTAVSLKASFFSIGFGFAAIPFENIGSKKMGGGICEGIIECQFFFSALALLISPLKMSAPIKWAETFAGVPLKARCFLFFFSFGFAGIPFETVGSNEMGGDIYGGSTLQGQLLFYRIWLCWYAH